MFKTLKPDHPRILAHEADFERVGRLVKTDDLAKQWYAELRERGEKLLEEPVAVYELRDGVRLLFVSREVLARTQTLAMLHRIDPDERYVQRVWAEMEAIADFPTWNPTHFLDVAEMALSMSLAYDWLYDAWSEEQRALMRDALVRLALKPAEKAYADDAWWTTTSNNWNQVCQGALITAALAVAEHEPQLAADTIDRAVAALPISMKRYAPDGGYEEGPGYWSFGTIYNVFAIAALDTALGQDFRLSEMEGFDVTGSFPIQLSGATGQTFNFADAKPGRANSPALFYLAKRFNRPQYARFAAGHNRGGTFDLLWYDPELLDADDNPLPLSVIYHNVGVVTMRSAWDDENALFLAVKAGENGKSHGQLDLGSFVLEALGERWIVDLGPDEYNLPGYFERVERWHFYRNRAEGHNTLVFNPDAEMDQPFDGNAPVELDGFVTTIDLSSVYGVESAVRTITLDPDANTIRVVDDIAGAEAAELYWFAHTQAQVTLDDDGRGATLEQHGKSLRVTIAEPADARFTVMDATPLPTSPTVEGQNPNHGGKTLNKVNGDIVKLGDVPVYDKPDPEKGIRKLAIHLTGVDATRIAVTFAPSEN